MIKKLQKKYALSERGAKDLIKGCLLYTSSALIALVPFYYIWKMIKEVLEVAPNFAQAQNLTGNGWMAGLWRYEMLPSALFEHTIPRQWSQTLQMNNLFFSCLLYTSRCV